jgi:hypothetical protein
LAIILRLAVQVAREAEAERVAVVASAAALELVEEVEVVSEEAAREEHRV